MAKKTISPIPKLEKELDKLKDQLTKAHRTKVAKLEKACHTAATKVTKTQTKLASLKAKKTPAAARQRETTRADLISLKGELASLKSDLMDAKTAFKTEQLLQRAEALGAKAAKQPKKKVLKKKAVSKTVNTVTKKTALTPDLDKPVGKAKTQPKKAWKPKAKTAIKKVSKESNAPKKALKKTRTATQKTSPPKPKQDPKPKASDTSALEASKEARPMASKTEGIHQSEPNKTPQQGGANEVSKTEAVAAPAIKEPVLTETKHDPNQVKEAPSDKQEEKTTKEFNWHTMPLIKPTDSDS